MSQHLKLKTRLIRFILVVTFVFASLTSSNAEVYKKGTFTISPLTLGFATPTFGFKRNDSRIGNPEVGDLDLDAYQNRKSFGFDHPSRNGLGYILEFGYILSDNFELFLSPFISYEKGSLQNLDLQTYKFVNRFNFGALAGARKYFDIESKKWIPHVALSIGFERQGSTKATAFSNRGNDLFPVLTEIGRFTLRDKTVYPLGQLNAGIDYKVTANFILTLTVGLSYRERKSSKHTVIGGVRINFKDNHNEWTVPITAGLKFAL